jgi:FtsH-binding integral membrane protein
MERFNSVTTRDYGLLSKVYGLLAFSIASAVVGSVVGLSHVIMVASHFWLFAILEFVLVFATSIVGQNKDMALPGFILLNVFTFITGFTLAPILSFALAVNPAAIVYALVTTAATFVGMSLVPIVFRVNVLGMGGFLFAGLIAIVVASLLNLFFHSGVAALVISIVATVLFSLYISYDTARILSMDPDAPAVSLALALYLDVLNLFVNILFLFLEFSGNRRN